MEGPAVRSPRRGGVLDGFWTPPYTAASEENETAHTAHTFLSFLADSIGRYGSCLLSICHNASHSLRITATRATLAPRRRFT